jgi:hypothetical protein
MAQSSAKTVAEYLKELPADRRAEISKVRDVVRSNLPDGYEEEMLFGMISYGVPLTRMPNTYNGQPFCYVALAAQKNFNTLYLMGVYANDGNRRVFEQGFKKAGKKLDMGKSCVHFKSADDLPLDLIGSTIASIPMEQWIAIYEKSRTPAAKTKAKKTTVGSKANTRTRRKA